MYWRIAQPMSWSGTNRTGDTQSRTSLLRNDLTRPNATKATRAKTRYWMPPNWSDNMSSATAALIPNGSAAIGTSAGRTGAIRKNDVVGIANVAPHMPNGGSGFGFGGSSDR